MADIDDPDDPRLPIWRSDDTLNLPEILFKNIKASGYYLQELKSAFFQILFF